MKHGQSDVEQQIGIQGIHLNAFWNYFWKRERSFIVDGKITYLGFGQTYFPGSSVHQ